MSGVDGWVCGKHDTSGRGPDTCPQCQHEASERMRAFVDMYNACEPCTVKDGKIRFLESRLAAAESRYADCKAALDKENACADECAEEAQRYLAERDHWIEMHDHDHDLVGEVNASCVALTRERDAAKRSASEAWESSLLRERERDAALAVLRRMVERHAPHSGLCCRYIDKQIVVCADSCECEELHKEARELCGMEPYAAAPRGASK